MNADSSHIGALLKDNLKYVSTSTTGTFRLSWRLVDTVQLKYHDKKIFRVHITPSFLKKWDHHFLYKKWCVNFLKNIVAMCTWIFPT